jgi:hypothetical protein
MELAPRFNNDDEINAALSAIGNGALDQEVCANALLFGEAERRTCTADDPGILRGMIGWGRPIRYLRERLRERGWRRAEPKSLPLVVAPKRDAALTVAAGNEDTGNPRAPFTMTKWDKGNMLRDWVEPTGRQLGLFGDVADDEPEDLPDLWVLLHRRTSTEIIAEVSRPTSVDPSGRLRFGGERILLKPIPIDQTIPFEDDEGDEPPAEVPVERI